MSKAIVLVALFGAAVCLAAPKDRPLYDDRFFEPTEEVVSPHITWARPYVTPPKVLFITHRGAMREAVEIAERLQMDYDVFAMETPSMFGATGIGVDASWTLIRGNSNEELAARLRQNLATPHDVIVIGGVDWDKLPLDCRYEILKQVKAGTGLVGCIRARDQYLPDILQSTDFAWSYNVWSGEAQGIADFFGVGVFESGVDYSGGHTGQAAVRIETKSAKSGSRESPRAGYSVSPIALEPNTEYAVAAWTKTRNYTPGGAVVNLYPGVGGNIAVPASDDWKLSQATFKTNDSPPKIGIYLLGNAPGTVWFDDVSLTKAGSDVNLLPNASFEYPGPAPEELAAGFGWQALPAFRKFADQAAFLRGTFQTTTFGQGRIGLVSYGVPGSQMMTPGPDGPVQYCREDYDYYMQLAIRLLLWGAKKSPPVTMTTATAKGAAGQELPLTVALQSRAPVAKAAVAVAGKPAVTTDLKAGETTVSLKLAPMPAGMQRVNLQVTAGGKTLGFGTLAVDVKSPVTIKDVALSQSSFSLGEAITGKLTLEGPATGMTVRLSARDNNGRLLGQNPSAPVAAVGEFASPCSPPRPSSVG